MCAVCRPCAALMPRAYFARRMSIHVSPSSRITGHMSRFVYGCMWRVVCGYGTERIYRGKLHRKQLRESKGGSPGKSGLGQGEVAAAAARAHRHRLRRPNAAPHAAVGRRGRRRREAARSAARRTENEEAALARAAECVVLGLSVICLWLCRPCFRLFRHCLGSYFASARGSGLKSAICTHAAQQGGKPTLAEDGWLSGVPMRSAAKHALCSSTTSVRTECLFLLARACMPSARQTHCPTDHDLC